MRVVHLAQCSCHHKDVHLEGLQLEHAFPLDETLRPCQAVLCLCLPQQLPTLYCCDAAVHGFDVCSSARLALYLCQE